MLRLVHSQTVLNAILIDDIDDGLPNKQVKRLGSTSDPNSYERDGYANKPKQPCYVPRVKPNEVTIPGYIDLDETQRVLNSAFNGKIKGFQDAGFVSVVSLVAADIVAPVITDAEVDVPATGDITIDGTGFLSTIPDITTVRLWGAGVGGTEASPAFTLTIADIEATSPGAVGDTQIVIDTLVVASLAAGDFVQIRADGQLSNIFTVVT